MNRIFKIAALGAAVCIISASLFGCDGSEKIAESYDIIKTSTDKALATEKGEILIHESMSADKAAVDKLQGGATETHIRYGVEGAGTFELSKTGAPDTEKYILIKGKDIIIDTVNGALIEVDSTDFDIFENFRVEYAQSDVRSAETERMSKGVVVHSLLMKSGFADKYDTEENGVKYDCTDVSIAYSVAASNTLQKVVWELTYKVTVDGETYTVVKAIDAQIDA